MTSLLTPQAKVWACAFVYCIGGAVPADAASVQIQVIDTTGKALEDAAVFLEPRDAKQVSKPLQGAEITQIDKQFVPSVLVVTTGTSVAFPNRDTVRHHVYSFSSTKTFELKLYTGTSASPVVFDRPGIAVLGCNIHDAMTAWVVVVDTPYFARTRANGEASMSEVVPGNYRLRVWHPSMPVGAPASEQPLSVGNSDVSLKFRLGGQRS